MFEAIIEKLKKLTGAEKEKLSCSACKREYDADIFEDNLLVCPECGKYNRVPARKRIEMISDKRSFKELFAEYKSRDFLNFPGYQSKLAKAQESTGENDAVVCGTAKLGGIDFAVFVMDPRFIMASMGSVVGEKITRVFEYATEKRLPVIGFTASGGARMQEGIISLMQMAKVSGAVARHSRAGLLYLTVLTDPTTGGVTASFAMQGDIILSEPKALIGFAGRRVVEQTTGKSLPDNFQTAEFLLENGFIDAICERKELRGTLENLLKLHSATAKKRRA